MPDHVPVSPVPPSGIQLDYFILVKVEAELLKPLPPDLELAEDAELGVRVARYPEETTKLRVEVEYAVSSEYLRLALAYRMDFVLVGPEPDDVDAFWRRMVARYAPTITMPYVRAMVHSLTSGMGSVGFLLPVMNYSNVFTPDEIELGYVLTARSEGAEASPKPERKSRTRKSRPAKPK